jgi:hypothetical protein
MAIISISDSQVNGANEILVADSSSKIPAKDGSQITILNATNVASGTIASARLDTGTTANKLVILDGSGNLPAIDASLLTGIVSATISASDPTISTNPSGGVGTEWNNSTSGEMYICTDATAGANVWTNVGAGTGDVVPYLFQGTQYGYRLGGAVSGANNVIDKHSYTSDGNATDVGDLTTARDGVCGTTSSTHCYAVSGRVGGTNTTTIERFAFATGGNASAMTATLTTALSFGGSSSSLSYGYRHAGHYPSATNLIEKFSHTADTNATDVGDLTVTKGRAAGCSDPVGGYGYSAGSYPNSNVIERFSYSSDGNAVDVGDLTISRGGSGSSSSTHGYVAGGYNGGADVIDKFAYGASSSSTDVGNLVAGRYWGAGTSSTTHGYTVGGDASPNDTMIDKYSYSSDGNATDVGDTTAPTSNMGSVGSQN